MRFILLLGAAYNFFGALPLLATATRTLAAPPGPADKTLNLILFAAGTAVVFGSMYVYLFFNPSLVFPLLMFGAALKTWAFLLSLYLHSKQRMLRSAFLQFGVGNGIIAAMFWIYIFNAA